MSARLDFDEVLQRALCQAARLMRTKMCSLMLVDAGGDTLRLCATYGASETYTRSF